jgi:hypothetical protein
MKVYVNLPEINFKWCKIKPSDLLKSWDPELELITWYFQMLEFLILKTESNNLDLITYTTFFYDKGPKYMGHNFSKAKDLHHHSTRGVVYQHGSSHIWGGGTTESDDTGSGPDRKS